MLTQFARALLVATSVAPVSLVYGLSYLPTHKWIAARWVGIAVFLLLACLAVMRGASARGERHAVRVTRVKNVDKEVLAFLVSYALPLISPAQSESSTIAFWAFIALLALVLYQADLVHVNPLLGILGYRFYEVERGDGETSLLITRSKTGIGATMSVIRLSSRLWLESPDAH